jgi:hypothetical protein
VVDAVDNFGVGGILLTHLFFLVGVAEDNDLTVAKRPEDVAVEVTRKIFGELLIS